MVEVQSTRETDRGQARPNRMTGGQSHRKIRRHRQCGQDLGEARLGSKRHGDRIGTAFDAPVSGRGVGSFRGSWRKRMAERPNGAALLTAWSERFGARAGAGNLVRSGGETSTEIPLPRPVRSREWMKVALLERARCHRVIERTSPIQRHCALAITRRHVDVAPVARANRPLRHRRSPPVVRPPRAQIRRGRRARCPAGRSERRCLDKVDGSSPALLSVGPNGRVAR